MTKRFGHTTALEDVTLEVRPGEVHAVVGENGAGKSTLIKILAGLYRPDAGHITLGGRPFRPATPHEARDAGIAVIHQERQLVPRFSGLENLFLGLPYPRRAGLFADWAALRRAAARAQDDLHLHLPLHRLARALSPAEQTLLEILRASMTASTILLLDEPTAALTDHEAALLFGLIRRLCSGGTGVIYVSHRLEEVRSIADRITVLRNGRHVGEVAGPGARTDDLVALITGRARPEGAAGPERGPVAPAGQTLLEVRDVATRDGRVRGASLTVRAGEVVGLFGLAGAGRTELIEALYGLRPLRGGEVRVGGAPLGRPTPVGALRQGMTMVPEDRRAAGLVPRHSVRDNMTLSALDRYRRWGLIRRRVEARAVQQQIAALSIRTRGPAQPVDQLSGGNQQKVVLARMLLVDPRVVLCDEPTHAVDVGTRQTIHDLLRARAAEGQAILFSSSDLAEVLAVASRVVVMAAGRTVGETATAGADATAIMRLCYAATEAAGGGAA